MVTPSGIVLPGDRPLTLRTLGNGLFVAVNAYEYDAGYFAESPLYGAAATARGQRSRRQQWSRRRARRRRIEPPARKGRRLAQPIWRIVSSYGQGPTCVPA